MVIPGGTFLAILWSRVIFGEQYRFDADLLNAAHRRFLHEIPKSELKRHVQASVIYGDPRSGPFSGQLPIKYPGAGGGNSDLASRY